MHRKNLSILICLTFLSFYSLGQSYSDCVSDFKANKYTEAISGLKKIEKSGTKDENVFLLLCLAQINQRNYAEAFGTFKQFYDKTDNPFPYYYALMNTKIFDSREKEVRSLFEKMQQDPRSDISTRQVVMDHLAAYYIQKSDFDAEREMYKENGDIGNWSTVGVFQNVSGSGFNKDFGVLAHPEGTYVFKNDIGADVKWFDITKVRNDRWIDFEYHYSIDNSIVYAQTFINSPESQNVLLKIGVSGSLKVWLNDAVVASEPEERNTNADVYTYQVKLQNGANRLLLQLGSSDISRNNFMVRIAGLNGQLLTNISSEAHYKPYNKVAPYEVKKLPFFAEQFFEDKLLKSKENSFINELLLLHVYNNNENKMPAYRVSKQLENEAPNCTYAAGEAITLANIDDNKIVATKERELIKTYGAGTTDGLILKYFDAVNKEQWSEAMAMLISYDSLYGESESTELKKMYILSKEKENQKLLQIIDRDYLKYPFSDDIAMEKYLVILNGSKDMRLANNILVNHLKSSFDITSINTIRNNDLKLGEKEDAKKWCRQLINSNPVAVGWYSKYASLLYDLHDYNEALSIIDNALEIAPYQAGLYGVKSDICMAMNKKDEAITMLKNEIKYDPTDYDAREKLNQFEGTKNLSDYCVENNVEKLFAAGKADTAYDNEDAVILLNDKRETVYREEGATIEQNDVLVLIKSSKGIEQFKELNLPYNKNSQRLIIDKAELLKSDGSKIPAEREDNKCVFSSLQAGDAIHFSYKLEKSYKGELAAHFWELFVFNNTFRTKTSRFSLLVPADKKFNYKTCNTHILPTERDIDGYKLFIWEENDLTKVVPEPGMGSEASHELIVSSLPDWNYVANWYSDVSNTKTQADAQVKEQVHVLMAGNENKTQLEKAKILYDYIERNFHYSNVPFLHSALVPQRASRTLLSKLGDCKDLASLYVSMAREVGLDANLVLVSTKGQDVNEFELPTIGFNHCIAQLHCDGKYYLVELTNNYLPFTAMPPSLIGAIGLYIPKNGGTSTNSSVVKLSSPFAPANLNVRVSDLTFDGDKGIIHRHVHKMGSESANWWGYYGELDEKEKLNRLEQSLSQEFNKNTTLTNAVTKGKVLDDTTTIDYSFTIDNYASTIAGMKVIKLPWTDLFVMPQIFAQTKRDYQMELWPIAYMKDLKETMSVKIPPGKKLIDKPVDVVLTSPLMTYSIKYHIADGKITATREVKYLTDVVKKDQYADVKNMITRMNEADTKELVFK